MVFHAHLGAEMNLYIFLISWRSLLSKLYTLISWYTKNDRGGGNVVISLVFVGPFLQGACVVLEFRRAVSVIKTFYEFEFINVNLKLNYCNPPLYYQVNETHKQIIWYFDELCNSSLAANLLLIIDSNSFFREHPTLLYKE